MRNFLLILLGALILYIVLKMISGAGAGTALSTEKLKKLAFLPQTANLIKTNEFKELIKTNEFHEFVKSIAEEQAVVLAQSLLNVQVKK